MNGMNAANVMIPGRGAIFTAAPLAAAPSYKTMSPDTPGAGWTCLGHTSKENAVALSKSGGESTTFDSWWTAALAVMYSSTNWAITVGALQIDTGVLDLAFNGTLDTDGGYIVPAAVEAVDRALFVLALQGTKRMGLYLPKVSVTLGDAPSFDPSKLFEVPLSAAVLAEDTTLMKWYHPALEAGLAAVIASASPATTAAAGATVTITGTNFTGVDSVKFGAAEDSTATVDSDTQITATMPTGTAGSAAITVSKGSVVSNSFPYARA